MLRKLVIVKTGSTIPELLEEGSDFDDWFIAGCQLPASAFMVTSPFEGEALPAVNETAAVIITGSPAYVTDQAEFNFRCADYLREANRQGIPILGVCYGHQLLAWTFGGKVDFHPCGREIGTVNIELTKAAQQDPLFSGLPQSFPVQVSHQQSVIELPTGAVLLGSNEFEPHHAFRLGSNCWGIQFHPEFDAAVSEAYIRARKQDIDAEGLDSEKLLSNVAESPDAASLLRRFAGMALG